MILSHVVTIWLIAGSMALEKKPVIYLPTTTNQCANISFYQHASSSRLLPTTPANLKALSYPNEFIEDYVEPQGSGDSYLKIVLAENT